MSLYDPNDSSYDDPVAVRAERDRTFQVCSDCRICVRLCPSFRSLFSMIDAHDDGAHDVRVLTDQQHDRVVRECYQCKLCYVVCPYTPGREQEWIIDFPRLMLRSLVVQHVQSKVSPSARLLARTDLQGKLATTLAPVVNRVNSLGLARTAMEKVAGIARERLLPSFANVRFSSWFRGRRLLTPTDEPRSTVALFPTCLVEYQEPSIGKAVVGVYERNRIACDLPDGEVCCGMPWLDAGDAHKFREHAEHNVAVLAQQVREGKDVVVPQPTCAYVLKNEYPDFLATDDARLVAEHTFDTSEYLLARHREEPLDTQFDGATYGSILWQAACHYRAQMMGPKSKQLMELTGAKVTVLERCSAIDGTWGLRAENLELAKQVAKPLMERVGEATEDLVAGDCHLSNTAIKEATQKSPSHPMQVMARAYGIEDGAS
ncbi:MAG TPA: heterodisulfide reductase-related iron-sulfur binding cluster [Acidimicrobiia bacterium]|nr:heterodisulfide reductase-related iron-sulfur binding cluster [Acidimicrobiia bacterium]